MMANNERILEFQDENKIVMIDRAVLDWYGKITSVSLKKGYCFKIIRLITEHRCVVVEISSLIQTNGCETFLAVLDGDRSDAKLKTQGSEFELGAAKVTRLLDSELRALVINRTGRDPVQGNLIRADEGKRNGGNQVLCRGAGTHGPGNEGNSLELKIEERRRWVDESWEVYPNDSIL